MGMQKCGTTALQYFMNFHPGMRSPVEGELHFFEREGNYRKVWIFSVKWLWRIELCSALREVLKHSVPWKCAVIDKISRASKLWLSVYLSGLQSLFRPNAVRRSRTANFRKDAGLHAWSKSAQSHVPLQAGSQAHCGRMWPCSSSLLTLSSRVEYYEATGLANAWSSRIKTQVRPLNSIFQVNFLVCLQQQPANWIL